MCKFTYSGRVISMFLFVLALVGCAGETSRVPVTVSLSPKGLQTIDQGQAITITATLNNEPTNKGVTWSLSGTGSLSNLTATSATYTAPASVSASTNAIVTATSLANAGISAQITITVNPAPRVVTTSLPPGTVGAFYSFTLQVSGGTSPYTWNGGSLPAWAVLNAATGTISGTPNATGTSNFSVTVTDGAKLASAAQALSLVVNAPSALIISTTSLPDGTVGLPYSTTLQATGGLTPYTWSLSSGVLPSWAKLDSNSGVISGTPDATGTANFTAQVTDSRVPPVKAIQALSIVAAASAASAELNGQYAFLLQGFDDATGNQFAVVGTFIADGKGKITSGLEDINGPGGYQPAVSLSGTYTIGKDTRGVATFSNSLGEPTTFALAVGSFNKDNVATQVSLVEFDDTSGRTGKRGTGVAYLQDTSAFSLSNISGPYAFQVAGQAEQPGTRLVITGASSVDGKGNLVNGEFFANKNGVMANDTFTATITATPNTASYGRVTVAPTGALMRKLVLYIVSASQALAMSTEPESASGLLGGEFLAQTSVTFSAASLNGTAVGYGVGSASICAGLWTFNGSTSASYSLASSDAQWIYPPRGGNLTYSVASNGRVTTQGPSVATGVPGAPVFYLVGKNKGFLMSTDSAVDAGFFEPQDPGTFSNASVLGNYFLATVAPALTGWSVASGVATSSGNGTLDLTLDVSDPVDLLTSAQGNSFDLRIDSRGFGTDDSGWLEIIIFLASPSKAVVMMNTSDWPMIMIMQQ